MGGAESARAGGCRLFAMGGGTEAETAELSEPRLHLIRFRGGLSVRLWELFQARRLHSLPTSPHPTEAWDDVLC